GFAGLQEPTPVAREQAVPVLVDAAAETDLRKYIAAGADLVIYSAHKSLNAPTAGIMAGRRGLIDACLQQNGGIGRTMKIGKEGIVGCLAALQQYVDAAEPATAIAPGGALGAKPPGNPGPRTPLSPPPTPPP